MSAPERLILFPHFAQRLRDLVPVRTGREEAPEPILLGRHLLEYGFRPSKELGQILNAAYEAQLAGEFSDFAGGMRWVAELDIPDVIRKAIRTRI